MYIYIPSEDKELSKDDSYIEYLKNLKWLKVKNLREEIFMSNTQRVYKYGRMDYEYKSIPFDNKINSLMQTINDICGFKLNVCILNKYDSEKNALGWHSDDSPEIDQNHAIVIVSYGEEREIWWKEKNYKGVIPKENRQLLEHRSVFIMLPGFQEKFVHKIPKHHKPCGTRISLTFRRFKDV